AAGRAALDEERVVLRRGPEGLGLRVDQRGWDGAVLGVGHGDHSRSMISVAEPWRLPSIPPLPGASARSPFFTCTAGCASPRSWRTASITLVMPPRLAGWLLQSPPPSVLKGSVPTPEIRLPSETNLPPWPFWQKPRSSICINTVMVKLS